MHIKRLCFDEEVQTPYDVDLELAICAISDSTMWDQ